MHLCGRFERRAPHPAVQRRTRVLPIMQPAQKYAAGQAREGRAGTMSNGGTASSYKVQNILVQCGGQVRRRGG